MARQTLSPEQIAELKSRRWELVQLMTTGASQVSHGDKSVAIKSQNQLKSAIEEIDRQLAGSKRTRIIKIYYKRGV